MRSCPSGKTLYLHIGIPKTASSWLQSSVFCRFPHLDFFDSPRSGLFDSAEDLKDGGWLMASVFKRSSHIWKDYGDAIFQDIFGDKNAWRARQRNALISDERIGRQGSRSALLAAHLIGFRDVAADWGFTSVKVLFLIRRQDRWLASHYAQMSDRNPDAGQADFERFLYDITSPRRSRYSFGTLLDFGSLYATLAEALGPADVTVLPYEHLQESPSDFLDKLATALDAPDRAALEAATATSANVRSEGNIWKLRQKPGTSSIFRRKLPLGRNAEPNIELTPDLSLLVRNCYLKENVTFIRLTGIDLNQLGY